MPTLLRKGAGHRPDRVFGPNTSVLVGPATAHRPSEPIRSLAGRLFRAEIGGWSLPADAATSLAVEVVPSDPERLPRLVACGNGRPCAAVKILSPTVSHNLPEGTLLDVSPGALLALFSERTYPRREPTQAARVAPGAGWR